MKFSNSFVVYVGLAYIRSSQAFTASNLQRSSTQVFRPLWSEASDEDAVSAPALVDKEMFVAAVDNLRAEMAKQDPPSATDSKKDDNDDAASKFSTNQQC